MYTCIVDLPGDDRSCVQIYNIVDVPDDRVTVHVRRFCNNVIQNINKLKFYATCIQD